MTEHEKAIINLRCLLMACKSAAQEDIHHAVVSMDDEAQKALQYALNVLEKP